MPLTPLAQVALILAGWGAGRLLLPDTLGQPWSLLCYAALATAGLAGYGRLVRADERRRLDLSALTTAAQVLDEAAGWQAPTRDGRAYRAGLYAAARWLRLLAHPGDRAHLRARLADTLDQPPAEGGPRLTVVPGRVNGAR